ncbi:MAG: exodeoxyribonuclease VII large subunit [Nocardioidaceae bacterium]
MALDTSFERPAPVRVIANAMSGYINGLGAIWVEGQIAQLTRRPNASTVFLTLRDPLAEVSVQVTCPRSVFDSMPVPITEGARIVTFAKFQYYVPRGTLSLAAKELCPIGVGELLARIEQRRQLLAAEGLFDAARKKPLPFLPNRVGLIVGRDSAAEKDVLENSRRRWPGVDFHIEYAAVQGHDSARQVIKALAVLSRDSKVDVIVIARGGGQLEDLLAFSDEGLLRAVAECTTPIVSAIGHEQDQPLLDLTADVRASTPTDAAKLVVPDVVEETLKVTALRDRSRSFVNHFVDRQLAGLAALRSRPALDEPHHMFDKLSDSVDGLVARASRCLDQRLIHAGDDLDHRLARVRALSPLATLQRGYAVLQGASGDVISDPAEVSPGDVVRARVALGQITAIVEMAESTDSAGGRVVDASSGAPAQAGRVRPAATSPDLEVPLLASSGSGRPDPGHLSEEHEDE